MLKSAEKKSIDYVIKAIEAKKTATNENYMEKIKKFVQKKLPRENEYICYLLSQLEEKEIEEDEVCELLRRLEQITA